MKIRFGRYGLSIEPRGVARPWISLATISGAVMGALLLGAVFLLATGHSPAEAYTRMLDAAFGSRRAVGSTLVDATPLMLTGIAAAVAFKLLVWNIGAEGQLYAGAIATTGLAIALGPDLPAVIMIPLVLLAGLVGGALWAALAAVPRVTLGTNEIITTLMLNFVALHLMNYLIFGSASAWRDPAATNFPQGRPVPEAAELPALFERLHWGIFVAMAAAIVTWWALRSTRWGFEVRVAGDSARAAAYAGISVRRKTLSVFLVSGAAAGLAGAVHVGGVIHALEPRALAINLGFTGIIVAALARLNPLAVIPVAVFIGALTSSGASLQSVGVPVATVLMLQGAILLFAVAGEFFVRNRVAFARLVEAPT